MRRLASLLAVLAALTSPVELHEVEKRDVEGGEKRVVCYYTNWSVYRPGTAKFSPHNINPYLCTHLIYAFGGLDRENGLRPYDKYQDIEQGGYAKFTGLKTYNKALKTMLAIGGWNEGSARFSPLVADPERRTEFVRNTVKFLRVNHFDGLDLDWEYPAFRDGGKTRDRDNYAQLVQELREEFDRESSKTGRIRLLLTMAVPAGIEYIDKGYDIPKLNRYLDFMNILSYDYHSAFEPAVNHHSPLYPLEEESEYNFDAQLSIDYTVKHYLKLGADRDKLVLGIPTYGRSYTLFNPDSTELGSPADGPGEQGDATREKGYLAYYEICGSLSASDDWTVEQPKSSAMGPYAFNGNQWVGYDDEDIVKLKAQYVNEKGLGGIMFWSIDNDDFRGTCHSRPYPLIEAGKETLLGTSGTSTNLVSSARDTKPQGGTSSSQRGRLAKPTKPKRTTTNTPLRSNSATTTPQPPTTPDPGSDFKCKDEGFFPHPRDCKKYFWCLDSGPSNLGIVAHQFTCPSGLFFNKAADSCDYARNVLCKKKSDGGDGTTTTTIAPKVTAATAKTTFGRHTTTTSTTTTTTEPPPPEEEEYYDGEHAEEDPQAIKQLIQLIKKLGGVAELEKQLESAGGSSDATTPAIPRSLYKKVLSVTTPRYQTFQRNGPTGPQNEGLKTQEESPSFRREKPQYVTIRRERPSTSAAANEGAEEETSQNPRYTTRYTMLQRNRGSHEPEEKEVEGENRPKYTSIQRNRQQQLSETVEDTSVQQQQSPEIVEYTSIQRNRQQQTPEIVEDAEPASALDPSTPKYVTLRRTRPVTEAVDETDAPSASEEVPELEEVAETPVSTTTTTVRSRIKILPSRRVPLRRVGGRPTTSTTEAPPSSTEKTGNKYFRRRVNKLKLGGSNNSSITTQARGELDVTTSRPRKFEFPRRGSRPTINSLPVVEPLLSRSATDTEEDILTDSQLLESKEEPAESATALPDLANAAVAAIQALATQPPLTTEQPVPPPSVVHSRRPSAQVTTTSTARPVPTNRRGPPRPFSKVTSKRPPTTNYDSPLQDYEDYYAEPVDVPLSGKVRIHTDGYIECLDIGNFPHPFSCRKFISCAKMEHGHILGWEYTCPRGLSFDPIGGLCNWSAGLGCKE